MAFITSQQLTYNYNTLVRVNDGSSFEFNTNATVLFVDELPSGVTLNATFESESNPAILLREKVQLRFKATNRIIFTPSAATSGTIRIFLFYDESNPKEFDMSFFSTEVVGTSDTNITQINSNADAAAAMAGQLEVTNWQDYGGITTAAPPITVRKIHALGTYRGSAGSSTIATIAKNGFIFYFKHTRAQSGGGVSTARINIDSGTVAIDLSTLRAGDQQTCVSFATPIRVSVNDTLQLVTDATFDSVFVVGAYFPDGF